MLAITENGYGKRTDPEQYREQGRNGMGIKAMNLTEKTGLLACHLAVNLDEDILLITDDGTIIRMPVDGISVIGRVSQGVRVMRVEDESRIVGVTATERDEEPEEEEPTDGLNAADGEAIVAVENAQAGELDQTEQTDGLE